MEDLATELIKLKPAVILAGSGAGTALVLKKLTSHIPIVFVNGADPVKMAWSTVSAAPRATSLA